MKIVIFLVMLLFLIGLTTAYFCISSEDSISMGEFKSKLNTLQLKYELERGMSVEAIKLRMKYFNPCE